MYISYKKYSTALLMISGIMIHPFITWLEQISTIFATVVGDNIKKLESQFSSLRSRLTSELEEKKDKESLEELLDSLTFLPIALRAEYSKNIAAKMEIFEQGGCNIRKIFRHLKDLLSFIDYRLLQFLIEEFGSEQLQKDMAAYDIAAQAFLNETTVEQLRVHWPAEREIPPDMEELRMVIDKPPNEYTLQQLDQLRKGFCSKIRLYTTVLVLLGVGKKNSFLVRWAIPSIFVPELKLVIGSLVNFYAQHDIWSVTLCNQRLYSIAVSKVS